LTGRLPAWILVGISTTDQDLIDQRVAAEPAALEVRGLRKAYGPTTALDGVDLAVPRGSVLGLLGPNGAGKTTLVSIVAGLCRPDEGRVLVHGIDVGRRPRAARACLGFAPQETGVYPTLRVRDNLQFFGGLAGLRGQTLERAIDEIVDALGLADLVDRRVAELSGGQRRRLHTALALVHRPSLVLLDEPTTGADVRTRSEILAFVRQLAASGSTILYSTHYLHEIEELRADVAFIDRGRIVARGPVEELVHTYGTSALVVSFSGNVPSAARVDGAIVSDESVHIPASDPAATAAELLVHLGPDAVRVKRLEIVRPSLDSVYLQLTGRRYSTGAEVAV
jgi:ABC-2 type transport system ATP-binding protein